MVDFVEFLHQGNLHLYMFFGLRETSIFIDLKFTKTRIK